MAGGPASVRFSFGPWCDPFGVSSNSLAKKHVTLVKTSFISQLVARHLETVPTSERAAVMRQSFWSLRRENACRITVDVFFTTIGLGSSVNWVIAIEKRSVRHLVGGGNVPCTSYIEPLASTTNSQLQQFGRCGSWVHVDRSLLL